jgi:hypothetical protein
MGTPKGILAEIKVGVPLRDAAKASHRGLKIDHSPSAVLQWDPRR